MKPISRPATLLILYTYSSTDLRFTKPQAPFFSKIHEKMFILLVLVNAVSVGILSVPPRKIPIMCRVRRRLKPYLLPLIYDEAYYELDKCAYKRTKTLIQIWCYSQIIQQ